ncbi:heavy metal transporter [Streptacidiphilus sp. P02-A3a]|nr:heavy metal transporter [Streptacidiphilus sp. P02-A3a]
MSSGAHAPAPRRRRRWLGCLPLVVLLVVAVGVGWYLGVHQNLLPQQVVEGCVATTGDGIVDLDVDQMQNASTITAVSVSRDLPEWAATVALATAMQESQLVNLSGGDLDSVGLFQQRPSQGWGEASQIEDPVYATDKFLDRLVAVPGYAELPLTVAAQDVQHSGYPDAYAQHEPDATVLSGALSGRIPAAETCQVNSVGAAASASAGASAYSGQLTKEFGRTVSPTVLPLPSGSGSGSASGSASASPSAATDAQLTVSAEPGLTTAAQRGWAVAVWSVAHCQDLHVSAVRYAGKQWTAANSTAGWQPVAAASGSAAPTGSAAGTSSVLITVAAH